MKELMKKELHQITDLIEELQASLKNLPEGTFYSVQNGKYTKWYQYTNGQCILIRKSDKSFARALAKATFLRVRLKEAEE